MTLKATVLSLDDEDYADLLHRFIIQLDESHDPDVPINQLNTPYTKGYLSLVTTVLNDPFKIDVFLSPDLVGKERRLKRAIIFSVIEEWLIIIGNKYGIDSLLDVRIVNEKLYLLGEPNAKQNISFNGVGEWHTRYLQRNKNQCAA
jgi:hypothetical protein